MILASMECGVMREIDSLAAFQRMDGKLNCAVIQGLDLNQVEVDWKKLECKDAVFLGCKFPETVTALDLFEKGATLFPSLPKLPYHPYRAHLYTREELMEGWEPENDQSVDKKIYDHFEAQGRSKPPVLEALAQRLHDHAIDNALAGLLGGRVEKDGHKKVVGIMGGHGTSRADQYYQKVVYIARKLTQEGYFIASGGGPGMMEAANLGAWLADIPDEEVTEILEILAKAPVYTSDGYMDAAYEVLKRVPHGHSSLAVPTWFYGHEPTNMFSQHVAKYFSNSIREDGLLAIAEYGVIFAPGSAGTTQEIFMDATQNHYKTFGKISPMIFLGEERYNKETMLWPCIQQLAEGRDYASMLACVDDVDAAVEFIKANGPR